jgi:hypothetical protein
MAPLARGPNGIISKKYDFTPSLSSNMIDSTEFLIKNPLKQFLAIKEIDLPTWKIDLPDTDTEKALSAITALLIYVLCCLICRPNGYKRVMGYIIEFNKLLVLEVFSRLHGSFLELNIDIKTINLPNIKLEKIGLLNGLVHKILVPILHHQPSQFKERIKWDFKLVL